jgi:hypothetical protein
MPACFPCSSFVFLCRGFKCWSCAIALSNHSKTSRDASKDHYHAFPWQNRRCCVEAGNMRWWYFYASQNFIVAQRWHSRHRPFPRFLIDIVLLMILKFFS